MKKIFILVFAIVNFGIVNAQNKNQQKETFDNNVFGWEEFSNKNQSAIIADGYLMLTNKKKDEAVRIVTKYPVDIKRNFTITNTFFVPEFDGDSRFGIIFNYADEDNYSSFLICEKTFYFFNKREGKVKLEKEGKIKLKGDKNQTINIVIQKQGTDLYFKVNNLEAYTTKKNLVFPIFGFYSEGKKTIIKVDEIVIEQYKGEDD